MFEGPLDLLLHLVRKNKLDIFDLPMSLITEQYLAYLEMMQRLDFDIAGEYLLMAATLIYIKSQMLLPQSKEEETALEEQDPRQEIVEPLLELAKFQRAARELWERPLLGQDVFVPSEEVPSAPEEISVSLFELLAALREVLKRKPPTPLEMSRARVLITEKIQELSRLLAQKGHLLLSQILSQARGREEAIAYFLALLELAFREEIRLLQRAPWEEVEIIKR